MSDHEFERQVQQKMDELKLRPSEFVWQGVAKELDKSKRRRRGLIWLPALLLLLSAGGFFLFNDPSSASGEIVAATENKNGELNKTGNSTVKPASPKSETSSNNSSNEKAQTEVNDNRSTPLVTNDSESNNADKKITEDHKNNQIDEPVVSKVNSKINVAKKPDALRAKKTVKDKADQKRPAADKSISAGNQRKDQVNDKADKTQDRASIKADENKAAVPRNPDGDKPEANEDIAVEKSNAVKESEAVNNLDEKKDSAATEKLALNAGINKIDKKKDKKKSSSPWKFGVNAYAGMAGINNGGLFDMNKAAVEDLAFSGNMAPNAMMPWPGIIYKPAVIKEGIAYSIGLFAERTISKRISLSAGVSYSQFNTSIDIGHRVDSIRMVNSGNRGYANVDQFYTPDESGKYKMRYHFLDIPVQMHWKMNKGAKLPITLNVGLVASKLLSTNALHFDGSSGVYYKNNDFFNDIHAGLTTGISFTLFNKSATPVSIGPSFRYQVSDLLRKDVSGNGKHLLSAGVSVKLFLKN